MLLYSLVLEDCLKDACATCPCRLIWPEFVLYRAGATKDGSPEW